MSTLNLSSAIEDFRRARQRATLKAILSRLTKEPIDLLSYEEVRQNLKAHEAAERGLQDIPLNAIVGSVNRYGDFTRDFLPRSSVQPERWARVEVAVTDMSGVPPIDVYKIGDVYFVKDGNHRVSVAQQLGASHIQAYVTEVRSRVPLTPNVRPEDLILKTEYTDFLEHTRLDEIRPEANLSVTVPGQYPILEEHISVHRYYMGLEQKHEISYEDAVAHWYDTVYMPIVRVIRDRGILENFPGRTETDLYLWTSEHRAALEKELNSEIRTDMAAQDLANQHGPKIQRLFSRLGEKLIFGLIPNSLEPGPPAGKWRLEILANPDPSRLFSDILVPINGTEAGWMGLEEALIVAQKEDSRLHGLHVVTTPAAVNHPDALAIQKEFHKRCQQAGITGSLVVVAGEVSQKILERARWNDLIVLNITYPPATQPLAAISSSVRSIIQRSPRPILATLQGISSLRKSLLAYDGSPKSEEALYVATYLSGRWKIPLIVLTVVEPGNVGQDVQKMARRYLETHGIQAVYAEQDGPNGQAILEVAEKQGCDLLLMGGYSHGPVMDAFIGSTVNDILRESKIPALICR